MVNQILTPDTADEEEKLESAVDITMENTEGILPDANIFVLMTYFNILGDRIDNDLQPKLMGMLNGKPINTVKNIKSKKEDFLQEVQGNIIRIRNDDTLSKETKVDRIKKSLTNGLYRYVNISIEEWAEKYGVLLMWIAIHDNKTRPLHLALDGEVASAPFLFTQNNGIAIHAGEEPNCRCKLGIKEENTNE